MTESAEANDAHHALKGTEPNTRVDPSSARVPPIAADHHQHEAGLDDASGCEFVDDRIRLLD